MFAYAGNNPIKYTDPDGRSPNRNKEKSKPSFFDNFKNDKFGRELLMHYLCGNGKDKICNSDDWQNYMRDNAELRLKIATKVLDNFNEQLSVKGFEDSLTFSFSFHVDIPQNEGIIGYSYLHGSNRKVGDVSVFVHVKKNKDGSVSVSYLITWNDKIDENKKYKSDRIKNNLAKIISFGKCKPYKLEVIWNDKMTITNKGEVKFGDEYESKNN